MISFLNHIVDRIELTGPLTLKDKCYVFPSRRASLYFLDLLKKKSSNKTIWAPKVFSIEEFVQENCPDLTVIDPVQQLFKLYQVYKKLGSSMVFEVFQQWGQTLLNDFDEIDRYMVDGSLLYKNLHQFEELENVLGPNEEVLIALRSFQEVIESSEDSKLFADFKNTWAFVGKVYFEFRSELVKLHWGYNGMCYRQLAENLKVKKITLAYDEVVFAGFNAISTSEEVIIDSLLEQQKATVYFDADRYYLDDDKQEAGQFLRKFKKKYRQNNRVHWIITDGFKEIKNIEIIGVEQKTAQAKAVSQVVQEKKYSNSNTAIVLADENLLPPLLYALPEKANNVNITMGYPVIFSPFTDLLKLLLLYQASVTKPNKTEQQFVQRSAYATLIDHPFLKQFINAEMLALSEGRSTYLAIEQIKSSFESLDQASKFYLQLALEPTNTVLNALDKAVNLILKFFYQRTENESKHRLEEGVVHKLITFLENLIEFIESFDIGLDLVSVDRIVRDGLNKITVPFSGEPLAQLQVMGFLESRSLDFENIIISSVNEDLLPASGGSNSYIPFGIRKAFKMPTFLEHNSLYAYHFYRLLQRAKNITLIYSTKLSITGAGERSRFILQLLNNFGNNHPSVNISERYMSPLVPPITGESDITIPKSKEVLKKVTDHFASFNPEKPLTPTVLLDYISCSLKYYFRRVLKIKEPDEPLDKIDARVFGNIFHDIIEDVLKPRIGKPLSKEDILALIKNELPKSINNAFRQYDQDSGEVKFTQQVIHNLVRLSLKNDASTAPLNIIDLESKEAPLSYLLKLNDKLTIPLGGKIDRLDKIRIEDKDVHRVIDYKTGHFELKPAKHYGKPIDNQEYIDAYFKDSKFKSGFQLLFYTLIQKRSHPEWYLNGGIIGIKNLGQGVVYLRQTELPLEEEQINLFEGQLIQLLSEILDPNIPFSQTVDVNECTYCSFRRICKRS